MTTKICNGLLPDGTKPLPEAMLIFLFCFSPKSNFKRSVQTNILFRDLENDSFKSIPTYLMGQRVDSHYNIDSVIASSCILFLCPRFDIFV